MLKRLAPLLALAGAAFAPLASAHHGPGPYDPGQAVDLQNAVVREWRYSNPHALLRVEATREDGQTALWDVETESPNILRRTGVFSDFLRAGDVVDVRGYAHRTFPNTLKLQAVTFADGTEVVIRRGAGINTNTPEDAERIRGRQSEQTSRGSGGIAGLWAEGDGPDWENQSATPAGARLLTEFDARDDPVRRCVTPGFPRIVDQPLGMEIIEQPHQYVFLYETFHAVRRVYMDGRRPADDTILTRMGYSVGSWEGDTLVVVTTHLQPVLLTWDGHPLSGGDSTRVVERYRRVGAQLELQLALEDPVYWQQPLTRTVRYNPAPSLEIMDYDCDPAELRDWRAPAER